MQDEPQKRINIFDPELELIGRAPSFTEREVSPGKECPNCKFWKPSYEFALVPVAETQGEGYAVHNAIGDRFYVRRDTLCKKCRRRITRAEQAKYLKVVKPLVSKRCIRCKEILPVTSFGRDSTHSAGLASRCKPCNAAYYKEYRAKHKEDEKRYQLIHKLRQAFPGIEGRLTTDTTNSLSALKELHKNLKAENS